MRAIPIIRHNTQHYNTQQGRLILTGVCLLFIFSSCAQENHPAKSAPGVRAVHAFTRELMPGNIPVSPEGRSLKTGPDTLYSIYLEAAADSGATIHWTRAWTNKKGYSVLSIPVSDPKVELGKRKTDGEEIVLIPAKGCRLWRLELQPPEQGAPLIGPPPQKIGKGEILLEGRMGKKTVWQRIKNPVELLSIPSQ